MEERTVILDKERASLAEVKVEEVRHLLKLGDDDEVRVEQHGGLALEDYGDLPPDQISIMLLHQLHVNELKLDQLRQHAAPSKNFNQTKHNFDLIEDEVLTVSKSQMLNHSHSKEVASGVMAESHSIDEVHRSVDSMQAVQSLLAQN